MARIEQYAYAWDGDWSGDEERSIAMAELCDFAVQSKSVEMLRAIPVPIEVPTTPDWIALDPADPTSYRREGDLMIPVAKYVKRTYPLFRHPRVAAGSAVRRWDEMERGEGGSSRLRRPPLSVVIGMEFTSTEIRVDDLFVMGTGDPITRTTLDAIPLTAMAGDAALRQCLISRLDSEYLPMASMKDNSHLVMDGLSRPTRRIAYTPDGRPPEPVMIDSEGVPWWPVQVSRRTPDVSKAGRRRRMTPEALEECWTVYQAAKAEGRPTTMAVEDWLDFPGSPPEYPSTKTAERWIRAARSQEELS